MKFTNKQKTNPKGKWNKTNEQTNIGEERQVMSQMWCRNPNPTSCRVPYFLTSQPLWNVRRYLTNGFIHPQFLTQKINKLFINSLCKVYDFYEIVSNSLLLIIMFHTPRAPYIIHDYLIKVTIVYTWNSIFYCT